MANTGDVEAPKVEFWQKANPNGEVVGKDPRTMTEDELKSLGHRDMSPMRALRLRCLDCCGGSDTEVRYCTAKKCPSWPFRMGSSPWRKFKLTDAQRENLKKLHAINRVSGTAAVEGEGEAE